MKQINWGIIGCGDVTEVKSGPAFQRITNSKLIAVMRRDGAKAKDFAVRHGVPEWYDDATKILYHKEINAIYIATPPSSHIEFALKALDIGKDIYLEKPMAMNAEEAQRIHDAAQRSTGKLVVAHYRRRLPVFRKVKELLEQNAIGAVSFADITLLQSRNTEFDQNTEQNWRLQPEISGGGYFQDLAPHQLDIMYHFFGGVTNVIGFSNRRHTTDGVADMVNGIIHFENGIQFRGIWNFNAAVQDQKDECTIYGSEGTIRFSFFSGSSVSLVSQKNTEVFNFENPKHIQEPMITATVDYFLNKDENPCPSADGAFVMNLMDKISQND
ncbi:Gfo/Idh/MocA family oxidoreductase [Aquimarina addita]|uniref:Gfo/Idh/MocA family oxidoreductase n=1 Tax=Aquimarina addita TaxID=870485 RepID=A0ABP6UK58_9FLAO